jgi:hypothetical protein
MVSAAFSLREDYWDEFELNDSDIEFLYNYLLEVETPLPSEDLAAVLVEERIRLEIQRLEQQQLEGGDIYLPKETYEPEKQLVFPALGGRTGTVIAKRAGWNPDYGDFDVIKVRFDDGDEKEFAAGFETHTLNEPPDLEDDIPTVDEGISAHGDLLVERLEDGLFANPDFVRIAFKWFPRALLMAVNTGHLNLAEAVLDMSGGGPLPTSELLEPLDLGVDENPKLVEFSLDLALQEDPRFDEVGPEGEILWYLKRLEPEGILETPLPLRYAEIDYDRSQLTPAMLDLERQLDDELSPLEPVSQPAAEVAVPLLYPHWRAGTLPLSPKVQPFFPTAYEAPRIRFMLVDGDTGEEFPGWVVREQSYVFGLEKWYRERELMPGSIVHIRPGKKVGEVIVKVDEQRSHRDWVRTVLVGTDGGIVFANLKQIVTAAYDERLVIAIPDMDMLDQVWEQRQSNQPPFERTVVNMVRELTKLSTQGHMHAAELYAAVNLVRRCPPGPIFALLASRPWFEHVGDLHFRLSDVEIK